MHAHAVGLTTALTRAEHGEQHHLFELAERGLHRLKHIFPEMGPDWTEKAPLPGGEIPNADYESFANGLRETYPWMPRKLVHHYGRLYGARTKDIVGAAGSLADLGKHHGGQLYEAEVRYLVAKEWAQIQKLSLAHRAVVPPERFVSISYEDLTSNPKETMQRLCRSLNVPYQDSMLDFHRSDEAQRAAGRVDG